MNEENKIDVGALSYVNWKEALAGHPVRLTEEYPFYSDAVIIGELRDKYGPYRVINAVSNQMGFSNAPAMVFRTDYVTNFNSIYTVIETNVDRYHGGGIQDEIAALISLLLGVRVKSGNMNRFFDGKDPKGHPIYAFAEKDPTVLPPTDRPILPSAVGQHDLKDASLLEQFPEVPADASIALIRAARLYQDAIWIVEAEPSLSWIMLVSAVETAAGFWRSSSELPVERMRESKPDFAQLLLDEGGEDLVNKAAPMIADYMGAGKKFCDFLLKFLPPPPAVRPSETSQHPWNESELKKSFRKIYDLRSKALHGGIPFPQPMCMQAMWFDGIAPAERSPSPAMGGLSGMWKASDTPMFLHTFEYIVRNALINWWKSMLTAQS